MNIMFTTVFAVGLYTSRTYIIKFFGTKQNAGSLLSISRKILLMGYKKIGESVVHSDFSLVTVPLLFFTLPSHASNQELNCRETLWTSRVGNETRACH